MARRRHYVGVRQSLRLYRLRIFRLYLLLVFFLVGGGALVTALALNWESARNRNPLLILGLVVVGIPVLISFYSLFFGDGAFLKLLRDLGPTCWHYFRYYLLPRRWTLRLPRYRHDLSCRAGCKTGLDTLCLQCRKVCASSRLLVGAPWGLIPSSEKHCLDASLLQLQKSAEGCHLCHVLLQLNTRKCLSSL